VSEGRRYKVNAVLGQGGFGTVYAAELLGEGGFTRKVALKVLNPEMAGVEDVANRLRDEARLLGILRHRAIVGVDGLVMLNDRWTVVMEHIEGADLQRIVRSVGPMPLGCALEVVSEVASALDVAYVTPSPNGVPLHLLHRDIKPPNIMLTSAGETKVLDFGIARAEFSEREAKTKSVLYGSIGYMAPERMEFQELPAGDIFALGAVLFELLDGSPIGKGSINPQKHKGHIESSVARLLKKLGPTPPEFRELLESMLSYDPEERPSAREVERRCRALRGQVGEPWLRDWAERMVPPLVNKGDPNKLDDFSGSIVIERSGRTEGQALVHEPTPSGRIPGTAAQPSPSRPPPPPPQPRADATYAFDGGGRPPPPQVKGGGSWLKTFALLGCIGILVVGGLAAVVGLTATGGLLALVAAGSGSYDTGGYEPIVDPYVEPQPDPYMIPEVPVEADPQPEGEWMGAFGFRATTTEPWKSMGFPLKGGVCSYSDGTTFVASERGNRATSAKDAYVRALQNDGWQTQYEYQMDTGWAITMQRGGESLSMSITDYEGNTLITLGKY
jgi:serine/threonine protein kinase